MEREPETSRPNGATVDVSVDVESAERLLAAQNRVLARIAQGCSVEALVTSVADYVDAFANGWHPTVHLVERKSKRLSKGIAKGLDASLPKRMEAISPTEAWPTGLAVTSRAPVVATGGSADAPWCSEYVDLEKHFELRCGGAFPTAGARQERDDEPAMAVISLFARRGPKLPPPPGFVLEVACSLLAMGLERLRTEEAEHRLQDCEERYALAARGSNDGFWDWNLKTDEMCLSPRFCARIGLEAEETSAPAASWWRRIHPDDRERVKRTVEAHLAGETEVFECEHRMRHEERRYIWVLSRGQAVQDESGAPKRIAGSLTDITKQKLAEKRLRHDALHDPLTGLPNRTMFMQHLGRTLERTHRSHAPFTFAVLFLDFDRFKRINDSLGHLVGDELLIAIAQRLGACVRPSDTVSRLGGDEFAILLEPVEGVSEATRVAGRIHQAPREPFRVSGLELFITVSIGIAIGSKSYIRPDDLLRDADTAMYRAKAAGKARHEVFDEAMHARAVEQLRLESALRMALRRNELLLHYQPVVSLKDGTLEGLEALTRWNHPSRGELPPAAFLPVAEDSGLIVEIGWWVLTEACGQMSRWRSALPAAEALSVHVNLSEKQLFHEELTDRIESVLKETGLPPERLVLDIPETVIMTNAESSVTILTQLKSLSLRIHLDDFGTGYSSLGYLHRFQIDTLKIDHSFIRHLRASGDNWTTVRAIIRLADNLGMDVIAEGVESEEQIEELKKLSCRSAQGSIFYPPSSANATRALLEKLS